MQLEISRRFYNELIAYCREKWPHEACGFIYGSIGNIIRAASFTGVSNVSAHPERHFKMDPKETAAVLLGKMKGNQSELIGIFHSHPNSPPVPSAEDCATLWYTLPSYWIVSLSKPDIPELQVYEWKPQKKTSPEGSPFCLNDGSVERKDRPAYRRFSLLFLP
jgi:proteasome lid subunit RPN8/RPN11